MPNFTEKAIKITFMKLLNEQTQKKISVRTIVEACGLNRNSFYYHFKDIPSLIEEIVMDAANALIQKYPNISTLDEALEATFNFTLENKKAVMHICNSVNREIYERYLMEICEYVVKTYFKTAFAEEKDRLNEAHNMILIHFTKCLMFGLFIDWINTGMQDSAIEDLKRFIFLSQGLSREMIERCAKMT